MTKDINDAIDILNNTRGKVLGCILNGVTSQNMAGSGHYGYGGHYGSERNTEMDSGILYFTTILDDMWRGFKKFFLLCFLLMAVCGAVMYMREKTNYTWYIRHILLLLWRLRRHTDTIRAIRMKQQQDSSVKHFHILTSGALSDIVAESLGVDSIPASISAEAIQDTSIFTINVTASDPQTAYDVLQAVIKYYPQVAEYIIGDTIRC